MPELTPDQEAIAAYSAAMTAAFQILISCLQTNGTLRPGEYQDMLQNYIEISKSQIGNELLLTLLHDLRRSLVD